MIKRKSFNNKHRAEIFADKKGICILCGHKISAKEAYHIDHYKPLAMGGTNEISNLYPVHIKCHALKTNGKNHTSLNSDKHTIAKHKRLTGQTKTGPKAKIRSQGFQTNRNSPYKKKMDGSLERRKA